MKGCVIALAILLLICGITAWNARYVRGVGRALGDGLDSLPDTPAPEETAAAVSEIRQAFEKHLPALSITVSYPLLDRITESLATLETYARRRDEAEYAATLTLLRKLARELIRPERLSVENIL